MNLSPAPASPLVGGSRLAQAVGSVRASAGLSGARGALAGAGVPRPAGSALGKIAKCSDPEARKARAVARRGDKHSAAKLLKDQRFKTARALSACGSVPFGPVVELRLNTETGRASLVGLQSCRNVWLCPCCSPAISAERRGELDVLLSGARSERLAVVMLTLTARHDRSMALAPFLEALKRAKARFRERKEWRALPYVGSVTATEVTHGANGWHPHFHEILLFDCSSADALRRLGELSSVWLRCLQSFGLTGNKAAFDVQDASAAGSYVAKFGAAEEVALSGNKRGRKGSRSPWELLTAFTEGDGKAGAIWREYAAAFHGRRQLVWSRGLKERFGVGVEPEADGASEAEAEAAAVVVVRRWLPGEGWRLARRRYCSLIAAAEAGSCLNKAEFGPTDAALWRRYQSETVLE